jgi:hypothetical protein
MNIDDVREYILWLETFEEYYNRYIDSNKELKKIFSGTFEKFMKVLNGNGNNQKLTEKDFIRLLKELVKNFSVAYDANMSINKTLKGPRNTDVFKQSIYMNEIAKLKKWLIENINDPKLFPNFERIVMYIAKKRQMIEFLKLGKENDAKLIDDCVYFENFGKRRFNDTFISQLIVSHAKHLYNNENEKKKIRTLQYTNIDKKINLTTYVPIVPAWIHTNGADSPQLFGIMNELYTEFLSLVNGPNNTSKRDILPELYWLYMQTCPFERGSAAIGEILFSVLLRKYFGCDFLISNGWNGDPLTIPDIHALHYKLDKFKKIFWGQLTNCVLKKNSNNNNRNYLRENKYFYYL